MSKIKGYANYASTRALLARAQLTRERDKLRILEAELMEQFEGGEARKKRKLFGHPDYITQKRVVDKQELKVKFVEDVILKSLEGNYKLVSRALTGRISEIEMEGRENGIKNKRKAKHAERMGRLGSHAPKHK